MKITILTNILNPFRIYFYDKLYSELNAVGDEFEVLVMADKVPGRKWEYKNFEREYTTLLDGKVYEVSGIHVITNPGVEKILRESKSDVVICAGSYMLFSVWSAIRLKKKLGYKVLLWSESNLLEKRDYSGWKIALRENIRKRIFKKFDGFWYAGRMAKEFIEKYAQPDTKYILVPKLVEEEAYFAANKRSTEEKLKVRDTYNVPEDKILAVCPARLSKVKGIPQFLELFSNVNDHVRDNVVIIIPGYGELEDVIKQQAKRSGVDVRLVGFKPQNEMIDLYSAADLMLLPSLSDPNPLSCIEAAWAGKALVVSEHVGNHPELVENGKNGFVFNYRDSDESIRILESAFSQSREWYYSAGQISLEMARMKYDSAKVVGRIIEETKNMKG